MKPIASPSFSEDPWKWRSRIGSASWGCRNAKVFADNQIDDRVLPELTPEDLKELGVILLGHRRNLFTAIEGLRSRTEPVSRLATGEELGPADAAAAASPER